MLISYFVFSRTSSLIVLMCHYESTHSLTHTSGCLVLAACVECSEYR